MIEYDSIASTIDRFESAGDASKLASLLFGHWQQPPLFDDAREFLAQVAVPVVVVSNIDRVDLDAAIAHHDLRFGAVITSDEVRLYKPRAEMFEAALALVEERWGIGPERTLHVGDSLTSDIAGAHTIGLDAAWINRTRRSAPVQPPMYEISRLTDLGRILGTQPRR